MRVLMFGWEFPPHIAGGLGTACYGMTKGLAYNDVDVLFVMPSASGDEDESAVKIINASDVAIDTVSATVDEFLGKVQFVHIGTNMVPYVDPQDFTKIVEEERKRQIKGFRVQYGQKYKFSGKYGSILSREFIFLTVLNAETFDLSLALFLNDLCKVLWIDIRHHVGTDMHELNLSEELINSCAHCVDCNITGVDDLHCALVLVS